MVERSRHDRPPRGNSRNDLSREAGHVIVHVNIRFPCMHCPAIQPGQIPHSSPIQNSGCRRFRISEAAHCARPFALLSPALSLFLLSYLSPVATACLSYSSVVFRSLFPYSKSSRPEVMRYLEEYRRDGWWIEGGEQPERSRRWSF